MLFERERERRPYIFSCIVHLRVNVRMGFEFSAPFKLPKPKSFDWKNRTPNGAMAVQKKKKEDDG